MVVVVGLRRREEGQVVPGVGVDGAEVGEAAPEPEHGRVRAQEDRPDDDGGDVGDDVLEGVRVQGRHRDGALPLVVPLVEVLVQQAVVEQPGGGNTGLWLQGSLSVLALRGKVCNHHCTRFYS